MVELKQLMYFIKVAEFNSYTRAADQLDVAQPLLSRHIRQLEVALGQNLFIRNGRGVRTTEAGNILLSHSYRIMSQLDELKDELNRHSGKITGTISLGIPPTLSKLLAKDIIKTFHQRLPDANLIVREGLTSDLQEQLEFGRLQVGLLHNPSFIAAIDYQLLTQAYLCLIVRKDDPLFLNKSKITAKDLETIPLIIPTQDNTFRQLLDYEMAKLQKKANIVFEIDSKELLLDLVEEGVGNSILLPMVLAFGQAHPALKAIPIQEPLLPCHLYMATNNKTAPTRLQQEFIKIIQDVCHRYFA
ncbi:LysR family transcriptional regulator [Conservatibacter flavescens]|uniref:LysR family transcriptional regulator n=1 Tax=Conservatibacter flavescens TaxID=28161 RepID=A0A2M8S068_9PAST|nr:LysR family transcriptional regulator [Conservatibacter flavescens]PJG84506.1 LysR family transcriptional regulator [Conservatibacter flavescens]